MKSVLKVAMLFSFVALASTAMANPKCSHRTASTKSDIFKNTNPKVKVDKSSVEEKHLKGRR